MLRVQLLQPASQDHLYQNVLARSISIDTPDKPSITQHAHVLSDLLHFAKLMTDEQDSLARCGDLAHGSKENVDAVAWQIHCRLVEHQQPDRALGFARADPRQVLY